jgi:peroxiredoxin
MSALSTRSLARTIALLALASGCRSTEPGAELRPTTTTAAMPAQNATRSLVSSLRTAPVADTLSTAELGAPAPDFELFDALGRAHRLSRYRGKIVVLEWFDPECPFVTYAYDDGPLAEMETRYAATGIVWLSVYSVGAQRAAMAPGLVREFADRRRLRAPILIDRDGIVARQFGARTTPHIFLINERGALVYSGALDNAPMGRVERASAKTNYVETAIGDLRSGHAVTTSSTRPYGSALSYARP